ncbi:hypothetical protein BA78_8879 [Aspergillus fumigatus]|nr:hypothetical protein BA78_8879 [Aspergillus fumigatus]
MFLRKNVYKAVLMCISVYVGLYLTLHSLQQTRNNKLIILGLSMGVCANISLTAITVDLMQMTQNRQCLVRRSRLEPISKFPNAVCVISSPMNVRPFMTISVFPTTFVSVKRMSFKLAFRFLCVIEATIQSLRCRSAACASTSFWTSRSS